MVPVTFQVSVPADTPPEVFLTGSFPGLGWEDWLPWLIVLHQLNRELWEITVLLPDGLEIEYLYTRSNWDTVERSTTCTEIPNRTLTVTENLVVEDTVENWRDLNCDGV
jgi:hypothetical protein